MLDIQRLVLERMKAGLPALTELALPPQEWSEFIGNAVADPLDRLGVLVSRPPGAAVWHAPLAWPQISWSRLECWPDTGARA